MKDKILVYLAGPISKGNSIDHLHYALIIAEELREHGYVPIVPQLNIFWHFIFPHGHDWWMNYNMPILERCDILLRLPGDSIGADAEVEFAKQHKIPICYSIEEIDQYVMQNYR